MTTERQSRLQLYSLGIVVKDKEDGSDQIEVYPVEELPFIDGKITDYKQDMKDKSQNAKGVPTSAKAEGDAVIIAKWLPLSDSNRMTPPDVIKNETVQIWRYADTDDYYWVTQFREPSIRRLETVCWMFGNLPSGIKAFDKDSSYWFEVSTKTKLITLKTTKSNNEPYSYTVKIDTQNGRITMEDDIGNIFTIDSPTAEISAVNSHGSKVGIYGDDFILNVPGKISMTSGSDCTVDSSTITGSSNQNTFNGTTDVNGITNLNQGMNVKGSTDSGRTGTIQGSMFLNDSLIVQNDIKASTIEASVHVTAPNID